MLNEDMRLVCSGYEQLTIDGTAAGIPFTAAKLKPTSGDYNGKSAIKAHIKLETAQIRYRLDGTAPDASTGMPLEIGEELVITGYKNLSNFKAIRTGTTSGKLDVLYFHLA